MRPRPKSFGLAAGETVILHPSDRIKDGIRVRANG